MQRLQEQRLLAPVDVTLRSAPNWTAVLFFAGIASLHWYMAISALVHGRFDTHLSLALAMGFTVVSLISWRIRSEMTFLQESRQLRLRSGLRRLAVERFVSFGDIRIIRLTLMHPRRPRDARIEIVCDREVVECPPTSIPRQQALCLAVTTGARLVKVYSPTFGPVAERLDQLPMD